jgi:hypothetical protein
MIEQSGYISPDINQAQKKDNKNSIQLIIIGLILIIVILGLVIALLNIVPKGTSNNKPVPTQANSVEATPKQMKIFQDYLIANKFEGVSNLNNVNIINGVYSGHSTTGFDILATSGKFTFPGNSGILFTSQVLTPDPSNPANKTFMPGPSYSFSDFSNKIPLGTVIQVTYVSENGENRPSKIDLYLDQIAH